MITDKEFLVFQEGIFKPYFENISSSSAVKGKKFPIYPCKAKRP